MTVNTGRLAAQLSPFGTTSGGLEKLTISYERGGVLPSGRIEALFNPDQLTTSRSARWEAEAVAGHGAPDAGAPVVEFHAVEPASLDLSLFFDTYERRPDAVGWARAALPPVPGGVISLRTATDVRGHTERIAGLTKIDPELHRPPVCQLRWGRFDLHDWVLTELTENYTMFLEDGTPVRATLTCRFVEVVTTAVVRIAEPHSADVPRTRRVARGDTLHAIAAQEYGDPARWREIARANAILDPLRLQPGAVLVVPRLQGRR
jgi:nucleoid-associated protein YgaU